MQGYYGIQQVLDYIQSWFSGFKRCLYICIELISNLENLYPSQILNVVFKFMYYKKKTMQIVSLTNLIHLMIHIYSFLSCRIYRRWEKTLLPGNSDTVERLSWVDSVFFFWGTIGPLDP